LKTDEPWHNNKASALCSKGHEFESWNSLSAGVGEAEYIFPTKPPWMGALDIELPFSIV